MSDALSGTLPGKGHTTRRDTLDFSAAQRRRVHCQMGAESPDLEPGAPGFCARLSSF